MATPALSTPTAARERLRAIIQDKSFLYGRFTLSSGRPANYFLDMKPTMLDPEGANLIADLMLEAIGKEPVDAVGGLAAGCIPIVTLVAARSFHSAHPIAGFFVRKEPKGHGTGQWLEGVKTFPKGAELLVVEDVVTTGGSSLKAIQAIRAAGFVVKQVLTIVDREEGGAAAFAAADVELLPLLKLSQIRSAKSFPIN